MKTEDGNEQKAAKGAKLQTALELIAEERHRQITAEGWTVEHDDTHVNRELALAGAAYAIQLPGDDWSEIICEGVWPFELSSFKPSEDQLRNLVKAGALLVAEIERLQRENTKAKEMQAAQTSEN